LSEHLEIRPLTCVDTIHQRFVCAGKIALVLKAFRELLRLLELEFCACRCLLRGQIFVGRRMPQLRGNLRREVTDRRQLVEADLTTLRLGYGAK
jgi:hypothetical protein